MAAAVVPTDIKLHVVFAGRGDAMILEYMLDNERHIIAVDGGPESGFHGSHAPAPYYNHFSSALQAIWGDDAATKLKIVNSHGDEDHWYGLIKLVGDLSNERIADVQLWTPFLTGKGFTQIVNACHARSLWPERATGDNLFGGLVRDYPVAKHVLKFRFSNVPLDINDGSDRLKYEKPFTGATGTNQSSILMHTATPNGLNGAVLFTGDSSSIKISPVIRNNTINGQSPHLAVYKIQHHGGMNDSMLDDKARDIGVSPDICSESSVWMLLNWGINAQYPRFWDETYSGELVEKLAKWALQESYPDSEQVLNTLQQRRDLLIRQAFLAPAGGTLDSSAVQQPPWPTGSLNPRTILTNVFDRSKTDKWWPSFWTHQPDISGSDLLPWVKKLLDVTPCQELFVAYGIGQCQRFYSSFSADSYVVSGTFQPYGHPHPGVLTGLATACLLGNRKASLYMTDATIMFRTYFRQYTEVAGLAVTGSPNVIRTPSFYDLFANEHLEVFHLTDGFYMTLDGNPTPGPDPQNPQSRPHERERGGKVSTVTGNAIEADRIETVTKALQSVSHLLEAGSLEWKAWTIYTVANNVEYFIGLNFSVAPSIITDPIYWWIGKGLNVNQWGETFEVLTMTNAVDPDEAIRTFWIPLSRSVGPYPLIWDSGLGYQTFEWQNGSVVVNSVIHANRDNICHFHFEHNEPDIVGNAIMRHRAGVVGLMQASSLAPVAMTTTLIVQTEDEAMEEEKTEMEEGIELKDETLSVGLAFQEPSNAPKQDFHRELVGGHIDSQKLGDTEQDETRGDQTPKQPTSVILTEYLKSIGFDPSLIKSRKEVLEAITGKQRNVPAQLRMGYDSLLLAYEVDLSQSTIEPSVTSPREISKATLKAKNEKGKELAFGVDSLLVKSSDIILALDEATSRLKVDLAVETADGMTISASKSVQLATRVPVLRDYLHQLRIKPERYAKFTLGDALYYIIGNSQRTIDLLLSGAPTAVVNAGLNLLQPDLDLSQVVIYQSTGSPIVRNATILTELGGMNKFTRELVFHGDLKVRINQISVGVRDVGLPSEEVKLTGSANIGSENNALELSISCVLSQDSSEMFFVAGKLEKIDQITGHLPGDYKEVQSLGIPLTSAGTGQQKQDLTTMRGSQVGFSIREASRASGVYDLSSVFLTVDLQDWKEYLPFSLGNIESKTKITVLRPTKKNRAVRLETFFSIPIDASSTKISGPLNINLEGNKKSLDVSFLAEPLGLGPPKDYQFQLEATCKGGITIADACVVLKLDVSTDILENIPHFQGLLDNVGLEQLSVTLKRSGQKLLFQDWSVALLVHTLVLIPDQFILRNTRVRVQKLANGGLSSSGSGEIYIQKLQKLLKVEYEMPQKGLPGIVTVSAPAGLSGQHVLQTLGITGLDELPVVGALVSASLRKFDICFGYIPVEGNPTSMDSLSLLGLGIELFWAEEKSLGPLKLRNLEVSILWQSQHDPRSGNHERRAFSIEARILSKAFMAGVSFDSRDQLITVSIRPERKATIIELMRAILPDTMQGELVPVVGDLTLNYAGLALEATGKNDLDRFDIDMVVSQRIELQAVKKGFSLNSLSVSYRKGKPPQQAVEPLEFAKAIKAMALATSEGSTLSWPKSEAYPKTDTLAVAGTVAINGRRVRLCFGYQSQSENTPGIVAFSAVGLDPKALALENLLDLLGFGRPEYDAPNEYPAFWDIEVKELSGSVALDVESTNVAVEEVQTEEQEQSATKSSNDATEPEESVSESRDMVNKKLTLSTARLVVENNTSLILLDAPSLVLQNFGLEIDYIDKRATSDRSGVAAVLYGQLDIAGHPLRVACLKNDEYGILFTGQMSFGDSNGVQFSDLTSKFLANDTKFEYPQNLNLPQKIPLGHISFVFQYQKLIQIKAQGLNPWNSKISGTNLKFGIKEIGGSFRAVKTADKQFNYDVYLSGLFSITGYDDFSEGMATLDIGPNRDKILVAALSTRSEASAHVCDLASMLSTSESTKWSTIAPAIEPLSFDGPIKLYINFTTNRFVAAGSVKDIGSAILMGRRHPVNDDQRGYYFSLTATRLERIFPSLKESISDSFTISRVAVQVLTYETTPTGLMEDLLAATNANKTTVPDIDQIKVPDGAPPKENDPKAISVGDTEKALAIPNIGDIKDKNRQEPKIMPGSWFFAEIELGDKHEMSSALQLAAHQTQGSGSKAPKIIIFAHVSKINPSEYGIDIRNLTLLGGDMEVSASGTYLAEAKEGDSVVTRGRQIDVVGTMAMKGLRKAIVFDVEYHSTPKKTWFGVATSVKATPELEEPFPGMFNVKLVQLGIAGVIEPNKTPIYQIFGSVSFGTYEIVESTFVGRVVFEGTTPRAVLVEYKPEADGLLGVSELYDKLIKPKNSDKDVSWPSEYPDFKFISAYIGYVNGSSVILHGGKSLEPGYHLRATVYVFGKPFSLSLNIGQSRDGIAFGATYDGEIDLGFAVLQSPKASGRGGLTVVVEAKKGKNVTFKVVSSISFFQTSAIDFDLGYDLEKKCFTGRLELQKGFLGVEKPVINFTYKDGRFSFQEWAIQDSLQDITDIHKLLERAGRKRPKCGELVNVLFDELLTIKFGFSLSLPEDAPDGQSSPDNTKEGILGKYKSIINKEDGKIHVNLDWRYQVSAPIKGVILNLELGNLMTFKIAPHIPAGRGGVLDALGGFVEENMEQLIKSILEPTNLSKIAALLAFKTCGKEIVKAFICRGAKGKELENAAEEVVEEEANEAEENARRADDETSGEPGDGFSLFDLLTKGLWLLALSFAILAGILWLIKKLTESASEERKKKLEDVRKRAEETLKKSLEALKRRFDDLKRMISIKKKPTLVFHSTTPEEVSVSCDWESGTPESLKNKPDTVRWRLQWSTTKNFEPSTVMEISELKEPSYTIRDPNLAYMPAIYVRIKTMLPIPFDSIKPPEGVSAPKDQRTKGYLEDELASRKKEFFGDSNYIEAEDWSPYEETHQIPFLKPPTSVSFTPSSEETTKGTVSVIDSSLSLDVKVVTSDPSQVLLYEDTHEALDDGTHKFAVNFRLVAPSPFATTEPKMSVCFVRNHSTNDSQYRHSSWVKSSKEVPVVHQVSDLEAIMKQTDLRVTWNTKLKSTSPQAFLRNGRQWLSPKSQQIMDPGEFARDAILTNPDDIVHGDKIGVYVSDTLTPAGSIALFANRIIEIDYLPVLSIITEKSYLDLAKSELVLALESTFDKRDDTIILGSIKSRAIKDPRRAGHYTRVSDGIANFVVPNIKGPLSAFISVIVHDEKTGSEKISEEWKLTVPRSTLPKPTISATVVDQTLIVSWLALRDALSICVFIDLDMEHAQVIDTSKLFYKFTADQLSSGLQPGTKYKISAFSLTAVARGVPSTIELVVPDPSNFDGGWSDPEQSIQSTEISVHSHLAVLQPIGDLQDWSVWSTSEGKVVGAFVKGSTSWSIEDGNTALGTGSSFACVSLSASHHEIYWITADGSIDARRWNSETSPEQAADQQFQWVKIEEFPFTRAGIASVADGGSLAAQARQGCIDIWWVDPEGRLMKARYTADPPEWTESTDLVYGEMGPGAKAPSKLSSAAVDDNTTDLFWLTQAGRISGEYVGDGDLRGNISGLWAEGTDALSASPTSSLTALASPSTSTRLWWITKEGSVQMAARFESKNAGSRKWHVSIVAGPGSASADSEIAAVCLNEDDLRLWWIGEMGELKHAMTMSTKDPNPSWTYQLLLPAGAVTRKGRKVIAAAAMSGQEMRVWFINNHGILSSMRWQQQTLEA